MNAGIRKALPFLALIAVVVGFANFFWVLAESAALGGDALNGYASDGHYFVGSHGSYTEVSEAAWSWSRIHGASVFLTHPLALAGMAYLLFRYVFPSMMAGQATPANTDDRLQRIRSSGSILASARTAGKVGEVSFSGPMLAVSVYPGGIVIKPLFMKPHAILSSEIRAVTAKRGLLAGRIEIAHSALDSTSPLILFGSEESPLVAAIERLAASSSASVDPSATVDTGSLVQRPRVLTILDIAGAMMTVALIVVGVIWAIPTFGLVGFLWTAYVALLGISNARKLLSRR